MGRSASEYSRVIDKVDAVANFQAEGNVTKCNLFAIAVMNKMDVRFPNKTANGIADDLYGNKFSPWYSVNFKDAQRRANEGHPTVAIKKASGHGHVAVVRPSGSEANTLKQVHIAQAGRTCYNDTTLNYAWSKSDLPYVRFYTCD